jgi:hypothetical protein
MCLRQRRFRRAFARVKPPIPSLFEAIGSAIHNDERELDRLVKPNDDVAQPAYDYGAFPRHERRKRLSSAQGKNSAMRLSYISLSAILCFSYAAAPSQAADTLTGQMAGRNFLLGGSWNCTTAVPAIMSMAARTENLTLTFDVAPRNVMHVALAGTDERGDEYFGYSEQYKNYWSVSATSHAIHGFATSTDGKVYTGTSYLGTGSMDDSITYTKVSDTKTSVHEVLSGNGNSFAIETTCTR